MSDHNNEEYRFCDYGGGTAGLVLAARLSEDPAVSVAVIEAGSNLVEDENILRPSMMQTSYGKPECDWSFKSEPQGDLIERCISMPRGKVLGGTSDINFLMVAYATRVDLDNWEKLGNPGWNFSNLAPYYRKFERFTQYSANAENALDTTHVDPSLYGRQGPIHITIPESHWPVAEAWPPTFKNLGLGLRKDCKSGTSAGAYSSAAFIEPNLRPEATRRQQALVTSISFLGKTTNVIATGVNVKIGGEDFKVIVKKEVILSAGAFGSPHILELSGIGSASLLESHDIKVVIENDNVGENLQDHTLVPYSVEVAEGEVTMESFRDPNIIGRAIQEYAQHRTGLLATPSINSFAFIPYTAILSPTERSQAAKEIDGMLANLGTEELRPGLAKQYQLIREGLLDEDETSIQLLLFIGGIFEKQYYTTIRERPHPGKYITIGSCLQHPFSRGDVHIRSSDPSVYQAVNPRYLSHPLDLKMRSKHVLQIPKILTTEPLALSLKDHGKALQPGYPVLTNDNVEAFVRDNCNTKYHPIVTCSMLPRDEGGVVDPELKVYGTKNLRVVDASVLPLQTASYTTTPVYALAEKAADMIKAKWSR